MLEGSVFGQGGTLKGKVIYKLSKEPISFYTDITINNDGKYFNTHVDQEGNFNFKNLTPGLYEIKIFEPGYKSYNRKSIKISRDSITTINIILRSEFVDVSTLYEIEDKLSGVKNYLECNYKIGVPPGTPCGDYNPDTYEIKIYNPKLIKANKVYRFPHKNIKVEHVAQVEHIAHLPPFCYPKHVKGKILFHEINRDNIKTSMWISEKRCNKKYKKYFDNAYIDFTREGTKFPMDSIRSKASEIMKKYKSK